MTISSRALLSLALLLAATDLPGAVVAQQADPPRKIEWPGCQQWATTTYEMNMCAGEAARLADERMNKAYRELACHFGAAQKEQLAALQKQWSSFRDADCDFWRRGGSIDGINVLYCRVTLADARAKELDAWPFNAPRDAIVPCPPQ